MDSRVHRLGECLIDDFSGNSEGKLKVEGSHSNITNVPECARTYNYKSFFGEFVQEIVLVAVGFKVGLEFFSLLLEVVRQSVIHIVE